MNTLEAFNKIYTENYQVLYRIACKTLNNKDIASDIVQDVFMYLHEKLQNAYQIEHPRTWLSKAVYNRCIDHLRKPRRNVGVETIQHYAIKENLLEKQEISVAIKAALEKLKFKEKMLVVLYSEGFSYKEMSDSTGIKMSSIGGTLSRTLKKMKKELTIQGYELY